jgi:cytochrome bd-type quinol oxidase subunit 2
MLRSLRKTMATLGASLMLALIPAVAAPALAHADQIGDCLSQGTTLTTGTNAGTACSPADTNTATTRINSIITTIINIFSLVVGIVAVIMIVVGGFKYITSGGDSGNITSAKNTIVYAVIGLVVVALAQFIVQFVLNKVNGAGA